MTALTWARCLSYWRSSGSLRANSRVSVKGRQPNPAPWQKPILQAGASGAWRKRSKRWTGSSTCCPVIWEEASRIRAMKTCQRDEQVTLNRSKCAMIRENSRILNCSKLWRNVDPVTPEAQFCDHGNQYRAAIFYQGRRGEASGRGIKTRDRTIKAVFDADCDASDSRFEFYPAEEYHQDLQKESLSL